MQYHTSMQSHTHQTLFLILPGGVQSILDYVGQDMKEIFHLVGHSTQAATQMTKYEIGVIDAGTKATLGRPQAMWKAVAELTAPSFREPPDIVVLNFRFKVEAGDDPSALAIQVGR